MVASYSGDGPGTRRRDLLAVAGALALSAFTSGRAAAQRFTATSISQAAQDARRDVGRLTRRADNLLRLTVADGAERGAVAVRRFRAEQAGLARDLAAPAADVVGTVLDPDPSLQAVLRDARGRALGILEAGEVDRRMRLLQRLGTEAAQREIGELAVILEQVVGPDALQEEPLLRPSVPA